ncbi:MAG TPA: hypothetical protein VNN62_25010 [Methylomirabilota bacterium]|nr:hypothetical protein [Methylomirabilota bacterium]
MAPLSQARAWPARHHAFLYRQKRNVLTMHSWQALPETALKSVGPISSAFLARAVFDFRTAGRCLQQLPYGRNADRADFSLVLIEHRGTCSTKHALLAALAREQDLPVVLMLGVYAMHERNTPGVGRVLARYGLSFLPEAHCYVMHQGMRIDVTRSGAEPTEPISQFLYEEAIAPEQIGDYKVQLHQRFLREWAATAVAAQRSVAELWRIREECIAALAQ